MSVAVTIGAVSDPGPFSPDLQEKIRLRAYEIYERRGYTPGDALQDWLQAEAELTATAPDLSVAEKKPRVTKPAVRKPAAKKKSAGR